MDTRPILFIGTGSINISYASRYNPRFDLRQSYVLLTCDRLVEEDIVKNSQGAPSET